MLVNHNKMETNEAIKDMLNNFLTEKQMEDFDVTKRLSESQKVAFEKFKEGKNIAIIASAGYGKSLLIKTMYEYNLSFRQESNYTPMFLTATTGIAAYNLNGMTIHSFMGFGTGSGTLQSLIRKIARSNDAVNKLKMDHILVIDEISMLSAELFENINAIYKHFRRSNKFFGGIQVIFSMDPMQLLPVFVNKTYGNETTIQDKRLIVESADFIDNVETVLLKENFRQSNDPSFLDLLNRVRMGEQTKQDILLFKKKKEMYDTELENLPDGVVPVHLVVSNNKAKIINTESLKSIKSKEYVYTASFSSKGPDQDIISNLKKELTTQFDIRGLLELRLKVNSRIMLIKNLDTGIGLVNGAVGTVVSLDQRSIKVKFDNGVTSCVGRIDTELELFENKVTATQMPLIMAYAITIHRCISLTLDYAIMDLGDCFCDNQFYTAVSRVKNLDGLLLKSFGVHKIKTNQIMIDFVKNL